MDFCAGGVTVVGCLSCRVRCGAVATARRVGCGVTVLTCPDARTCWLGILSCKVHVELGVRRAGSIPRIGTLALNGNWQSLARNAPLLCTPPAGYVCARTGTQATRGAWWERRRRVQRACRTVPGAAGLCARCPGTCQSCSCSAADPPLTSEVDGGYYQILCIASMRAYVSLLTLNIHGWLPHNAQHSARSLNSLI